MNLQVLVSTFREFLSFVVTIIAAGSVLCAQLPERGQQQVTESQRAMLERANEFVHQANRFYGQGEYQNAADATEQALMIRERIWGSEHPGTATTISDLGAFHKLQGDYETAEPLYRRALRIREKVLGPEHPDTATSLNNLARLCEAQADFVEAKALHERALKIREKVLGPVHPDTAQSLNNLGLFHESQGNYSAAEPLFKRALEIREKAHGLNHRDTAQSLNNLGYLYESQAKYVAAEPLYQQALKIREKVLGPEHPDTATSLNNLASLFHSQGKYAEAEQLYRRALKITEATLGPWHPDTAGTLNNLALLHYSQADYASAEPHFRRALAIKEKVFGTQHPTTANGLNNLAALYYLQGNTTAAKPLYERALRICETVLGSDHPQTATNLNNLADLNKLDGNYVVAESLYHRALKIRETVLGPEHVDTANSLNNLADLYKAQKNYGSAESLYQRAVMNLEQAFGAEHPDTSIAIENLASLYFVQGRNVEAMSEFERSRKGQLIHVTRVLPALPQKSQYEFLNHKYTPSFHAALSMALAQSTDAEVSASSAAWLMNGKGVTHSALAQRSLLSRDVQSPTLGPVVSELQSVRSQLASLAMSKAESGQDEQRRLQLNGLMEREQELSARLLPVHDTASGDWVERERIQAALPAGSVFVDFARFDVRNFSASGQDPKWLPARYAAWVTSPGPAVTSVIVDLGDAATIETRIEAVRAKIDAVAAGSGSISDKTDEASEEAISKDLSSLAELILEPLLPHIGTAERIVLSPDGGLWLVPWCALPVGKTGDQYLLERYSLQLVISGRAMIAVADRRTTETPVILANPAFDQQRAQKRSAMLEVLHSIPPEDEGLDSNSAAHRTLPRVPLLPSTEIEALAIQPHIESLSGKKAAMFRGEHALEQVAKSMRSPYIAAFATHGFFLPQQVAGNEDANSIQIESSRSMTVDTTGKLFENPLLRCGLLLAGCNDRDSVVGDDDGILTGLEIVSIDFRGTELVVLSACETGTGDVRSGEGVAGLRQAFQLAGAQAVVSTLWQIPDRDSALLMSKFFEELAAGKSKSEALRKAQLERIEKRRERYGAAHPFFWAAFTLTGS